MTEHETQSSASTVVRGTLWGWCIVSVILLILCGAVGYLTHWLWRDHVLLVQLMQTVEHNTQLQKRTQDDFMRDWQTQVERLHAALSADQELAAEVARLEVDHWMRLSEEQMWTEHTQEALMFLNLAQKRLTDVGPEARSSLERIISERIESIRAHPPLNINVIWSELDQLSRIFAAVPERLSVPLPVEHNTRTSPSWNWREPLQSFRSLFVIRHISANQDWTVWPDERAHLRNLLMMRVYAAQWAVLNRQKNMYEENIKWIQEHLNTLFLPEPMYRDCVFKVKKLLDIGPQIEPMIWRSFGSKGWSS